MKNKMSNVRDHLIATLEGLTDRDHPMEIDRARVIAEVAQTLVNSAKVEVDAVRAASEFFEVTGKTAPTTGFLLMGPSLP